MIADLADDFISSADKAGGISNGYMMNNLARSASATAGNSFKKKKKKVKKYRRDDS